MSSTLDFEDNTVWNREKPRELVFEMDQETARRHLQFVAGRYINRLIWLWINEVDFEEEHIVKIGNLPQLERACYFQALTEIREQGEMKVEVLNKEEGIFRIFKK